MAKEAEKPQGKHVDPFIPPSSSQFTFPPNVSCNYVLLQIAVDSIENIRTVAALGIEENFFRQ